MPQIHLAGDKLFVDFAGRTAEVIDAGTGEIIPVQIFVAVLGASSFTYARRCGAFRLVGRPGLSRGIAIASPTLMTHHPIAQIDENRNPNEPAVSCEIDYFKSAAQPPCSKA
jgi:hypothetical protein